MLAMTPDRHQFETTGTSRDYPLPAISAEADSQSRPAGAFFWTRPRAWVAMLLWCGAVWAAVGYGVASLLAG